VLGVREASVNAGTVNDASTYGDHVGAVDCARAGSCGAAKIQGSQHPDGGDADQAAGSALGRRLRRRGDGRFGRGRAGRLGRGRPGGDALGGSRTRGLAFGRIVGAAVSVTAAPVGRLGSIGRSVALAHCRGTLPVVSRRCEAANQTRPVIACGEASCATGGDDPLSRA
jgi:hypothetical protein